MADLHGANQLRFDLCDIRCVAQNYQIKRAANFCAGRDLISILQ